ncbi:MAG: IclR family transcriptional regulator [Vicinamibacterales bacterium]
MLDRAMAVLRSLADADGELTPVEIARAVALHKSTVHRLLVVLEQHRLVQKGSGAYRLGIGLLELGEKASARLRLSERSEPHLRELAAQTGEGAHVTVLSDTEMLAIAHVEGRWNLQSLTRTGLRTQIHCTAAGKAVLAYLSPETRDALVARLPFPRLTRRTIVTPAAFQLELRRVRTAGYAIDDEEFEDGLRCVGAPVFDHRGAVVASLSLAAPVFRLNRARLALVIRLVTETAGRLSAELGYQPPAQQLPPAGRPAARPPAHRR